MWKHTFGFGDQLVGLISAILAARKTNKQLVIVFNQKDYLESLQKIFDMQTKKTISILLVSDPSFTATNFKNNNYNNNSNFSFTNLIDIHLKEDLHYIETFVNSTILQTGNKPKILYTNQPIASYFYKKNGKGNQQQDKREKEEYIQDLFDAFRSLQDLKIFSWKDEIIQNWKSEFSKQDILGIQVRTGDKSIPNSHLYHHCILKTEDYETFSQSLMEQIYCYVENYNRSLDGFYLASDDVRFIEIFKRKIYQLFPNKKFYSLGLQENSHYMNATGSSFENILREYYMLCQCSALITSKNSNFGLTSAYFSGKKKMMIYETLTKKDNDIGTQIQLKLYDLCENPIQKEDTFFHDFSRDFVTINQHQQQETRKKKKSKLLLPLIKF